MISAEDVNRNKGRFRNTQSKIAAVARSVGVLALLSESTPSLVPDELRFVTMWALHLNGHREIFYGGTGSAEITLLASRGSGVCQGWFGLDPEWDQEGASDVANDLFEVSWIMRHEPSDRDRSLQLELFTIITYYSATRY
jgi:hypothetical protein